MKTTREKNAALRVLECEKNLRSLEEAALTAALKGTASVSITANGATKSMTKLSPKQIAEQVAYWKSEKSRAANILIGRASGIKSVMITRS